jgi:hypothetical protein
MVAKFTSGTTTQFLMTKATSGTQGLNLFISGQNLIFRPQTFGLTTNNIQQSGVVDAAYHIIVCRRNSGIITGNFDGTAFTTDNGAKVNNGDLNNDADFRVGATSTGGLDTDMDLAETLIGTGTLSDLNRSKLEGYLAHKWGLKANLPSNHPYRYASPKS